MEVLLIEYLALSARLALAAIFLVAAAGKVRTFRELAVPLHGLGVPRSLAGIATAALIAYEAGLAALLASGLLPLIAIPAAAVLLGAFVTVALFALASGRQIACNCFGASSSVLGWRTVARSLLMGLALAAYAAAPVFTAHLAWPAVLRVGVLVAALAMAMPLLASWVLTAPSVLSLARRRRASQRLTRQLLAAASMPTPFELDILPPEVS
jgi:hypothetical protein